MMGVVQHHDAITGTAKQYVTFDYQWNLAKAFDKGKIVYGKYLQDILHKKTGLVLNGKEQFVMCHDMSQNDTASNCPINQH